VQPHFPVLHAQPVVEVEHQHQLLEEPPAGVGDAVQGQRQGLDGHKRICHSQIEDGAQRKQMPLIAGPR